MSKSKGQTKIVSIKGLDKDFKCRGFQFKVGKTYKVEGKIGACENGFHACENPFDVWSYYPLINDEGNFSRYAEVEQSGDIDREGTDTKIASAEITIKAELKLPDFIKRAVSWVIVATKDKSESGDYAQIGSSGGSARIGSSGDYAQIGSSGGSARIGSSGDSARIGSSGDSARIGSSGDYARIGSSGYSAQIGADGKDSVIASAGINTKVRAAKGTWVSVAEYDENNKCIGFATGCIGKDGLKPDVWYIAKNGKLTEAES